MGKRFSFAFFILTGILLFSQLAGADPDLIGRSDEVRVIGVMKPTFDSEQVGAQLVQADTLVKASAARAKYGYTGSGYAVAIIDTGVDYTHSALGGGFGNRVIAGYDFVNNDGDPMDDNGHGTHVAGIAAGNDSTYKGMAPDANIIALKVLNSSGSGSYASVESALQWVIANRVTYNIVSINMSLGSGNYSSLPSTILEDELTTLVDAGVTICVSSGNSFYSYSSVEGLAYPAVSSKVISVGAVWDANVGTVTWGDGAKDNSTAPLRVTSFSQRNGNLSIVAPGAMITAAYLGGGFSTLAGTSMASPIVAGAAVIMHQALDDRGRSDLANQSRILQFFRENGTAVNDGDDEDDNVTNTGHNYKSLDLEAAMDDMNAVAPPGISTPTFTPTNTPTFTPTPTATLTPTSTPLPVETAAPTPTNTPIPTVSTPQEVSDLLRQIVDAVLQLRGRLNGSDSSIVEILNALREILYSSLGSGSQIGSRITVRLIRIDSVSGRIARLSAIQTNNTARKKIIRSKIKASKITLKRLEKKTQHELNTDWSN